MSLPLEIQLWQPPALSQLSPRLLGEDMDSENITQPNGHPPQVHVPSVEHSELPSADVSEDRDGSPLTPVELRSKP